MLKYALLFLLVSLIAGALGFTNVSVAAKRVSFVLFGVFFVVFLGVIAFAVAIGQAVF